MPFDGRDVPMLDALVKLDAVTELLRDEARWCKGALTNRYNQLCIVGALHRTGSAAVLKPIILDAARELTGERYIRIERFNDDARTTHAMVLQVLDRARIAIASGRYAAPVKQGVEERCRSLFQRAYLRLTGRAAA